jgi:hypothetical protein
MSKFEKWFYRAAVIIAAMSSVAMCAFAGFVFSIQCHTGAAVVFAASYAVALTADVAWRELTGYSPVYRAFCWVAEKIQGLRK